MILLGLLPKIGAIVAAIPAPVLGGASVVLFATVAVIGIQTLSRVDFHDERNVVVVAISLRLAIVPVAFPNFYHTFPSWLQIVVGSGITMGSLAAIGLNLAFNVLSGKQNLVQEVVPTPHVTEQMTIEHGQPAEPAGVRADIRSAVPGSTLDRRASLTQAPLREPVRSASCLPGHHVRGPARAAVGAHPLVS